MRTARTSRGFTLIEIMAALAAVSVLILAMGSTLFWLLRGEQQSVAANDAFNRTDLIRDVLHTNLRAGRAIRFPTTDALVSYPADGPPRPKRVNPSSTKPRGNWDSVAFRRSVFIAGRHLERPKCPGNRLRRRALNYVP